MPTWYTVTVVTHDHHPSAGDSNPTELVAATVTGPYAADILRRAADQIDPPRPVMRRPDRLTVQPHVADPS